MIEREQSMVSCHLAAWCHLAVCSSHSTQRNPQQYAKEAHMIRYLKSFLCFLSVYLTLSCFGLLLFCELIVAEDRFEKQVSITVNKQPLSIVLNQISQLTGYTFKYDQDWSDLSVTVNAIPSRWKKEIGYSLVDTPVTKSKLTAWSMYLCVKTTFWGY